MRDCSDVVQKTFTTANDESNLEITLADVQAAVNYTCNWSASGRDTIYNFWLEYLASLHLPLARQFTVVLRDPEQLAESVLQLRTLLIPKVSELSVGDYRPITIMSNLPKLLSKIVLVKAKHILLENCLISENQGAFGDNTIWFKEQVLLNEVIQSQHKGKLTTAWLDVKETFDSAPHNYVLSILKQLPINKAVPKLIERIYHDPSIRLELPSGRKFQHISSIPLKKECSTDMVYHPYFLLELQKALKAMRYKQEG